MTVDWIAKTLSMFALAVSIGFASCVDALQFNRIEATLEKVASLLRGKGGNADVPTVPGPLMDATEIIAQLAEARRELKSLRKTCSASMKPCMKLAANSARTQTRLVCGCTITRIE